MQGSVDFHGCFIDVNIGWPGRVHDARIWANSKIYAKLQAGSFFPSGLKDTINGREFSNLYLLGDAAYPSSPSLAKGFTGSGLTKNQDYFNWKLSGARMAVERAFGRLKGRWKILQSFIGLGTLKGTLEYIGACCILHNLCEKRSSHYQRAWDQNVDRQTQFDIYQELKNAGPNPTQGDDDEADVPEQAPQQPGSEMTQLRDALFASTRCPPNWRGRNY